MGLYRDDGVVLRTYKLGEADRIVSILTRQHGKVRAVAKGVRKTKSKFGARLEPPTHLQLQFYEGRELDIVTQAETIDHFRTVREDLDRLTRAVSMLEAADQLSLDREPNAAMYQMLVGPLVVAGFFLKVLALEGYGAAVDACVECQTDVNLVSFDLEAGGVRCTLHQRGPSVTPEAMALVQDILGGRLGSALNTPGSPATAEVDHLARRSMEYHLERRLRSLSVLE